MTDGAFDYVIVGGGVAGCILANRLSADPGTRVLLLEAGGNDSSPLIAAPGGLLPIMMSGSHMWQYMSAPQQHLDGRMLYLPRGKVLGGGSSINGMAYDRGMHSDYDRWAQAGNRGWSFAEVLPYFKRLESFGPADNGWHGQDGPIQVTRAAQNHPFGKAFIAAGEQAGYPYCDDLNGATRLGFGAVDLTVGNGRRSSASSAYLRPVRKRPNLSIITGAHSRKIQFDGERASGIACRIDGDDRIITARREVILCAGAINSPQLLMLSGVGPADHLREHGIEPVHALPGVGQGLQDHLATHVKYRSTKPYSMLRYLNPVRGAVAMGQYLLFKSGPLADPGMSTACFVKSDPALEEADIKMLLVSALFANNGQKMVPMHGFYAHINVARPEARGSVTLASSDPDAPPVIDQNYNGTENDRRVMREGVKIARRIFAQAAFDDMRGEELAPGPDVQSDEQIDAYVRAMAEADCHSVGTARMGSDPMAVVDAELRVHGLAGLRVVDASIMPHLPGGNTAIPRRHDRRKGSRHDHGQAALARCHTAGEAMMKVEAMVCHAPGEPLVLETLDLAPPGPDDVLIEIMASGLCHTDLSQLEGKAAPYPFPVVVGHEGAGIVREIGANVTSVAAGDHVVPLAIGECGACGNCRSGKTNLCEMFLAEMAAPVPRFSLNGKPVSSYSGVGTLARFVVMNERNVAKIRQDVPFHLACTIGCAVATGVGAAINTAHVEKGSSVAVFGLGGIGLNVVQGARLAGAAMIIGVDINPHREDQGKRFGLTHFVNPAKGDPVAQIQALTGGGADYSFECVGHSLLMQQAFDCTRIGCGCTTILGVPPDGEVMRIVPFSLQLGRTVKGSFMGNVKGRSELPGLLDHVAAGRLNLDDLVTHRLPMREVNAGFDLMKSGEALRVVVSFVE